MATELDRARAQVEEALALCDSETADGIIGSPPPEEYGVLVQGVKAAYQMLWMMAKANGLKQNPTTFRMGAQAMLMLATIVHYAYALGIRRGRTRIAGQERIRGMATGEAFADVDPVTTDGPGTGAGSRGE